MNVLLNSLHFTLILLSFGAINFSMMSHYAESILTIGNTSK